MGRGHIVLALLVLGCEPAEPELVIDLRTDLVPTLEFDSVRVDVLEDRPTGGPIAALRSVESYPSPGDDFVAGVRVAEIGGLPSGSYYVRVQAVGDRGRSAETFVVVELTESRVVTVLLTRDCLGVVCPGPSDSPTAVACLGGRCVDPSCRAPDDEECGPRVCATAGDCTTTFECAVPYCVEGLCYLAADRALCMPGEGCDPELGCVGAGEDGGLDAGSMDAGSGDAGPSDGGLDAATGDAGGDSGSTCSCTPGESLGRMDCDVCYHRECQPDCMSTRCEANSGSNCEYQGGGNFQSCFTGSGASGSEFCVMLGGNCNWSGSCCVLGGGGCNTSADCCVGGCTGGTCS